MEAPFYIGSSIFNYQAIETLLPTKLAHFYQGNNYYYIRKMLPKRLLQYLHFILYQYFESLNTTSTVGNHIGEDFHLPTQKLLYLYEFDTLIGIIFVINILHVYETRMIDESI